MSTVTRNLSMNTPVVKRHDWDDGEVMHLIACHKAVCWSYNTQLKLLNMLWRTLYGN
jgi:hypothetical protein